MLLLFFPSRVKDKSDYVSKIIISSLLFFSFEKNLFIVEKKIPNIYHNTILNYPIFFMFPHFLHFYELQNVLNYKYYCLFSYSFFTLITLTLQLVLYINDAVLLVEGISFNTKIMKLIKKMIKRFTIIEHFSNICSTL